MINVGNSAFMGIQNVNIQDRNNCGDLIGSEIFKKIKNNPGLNLKQLMH